MLKPERVEQMFQVLVRFNDKYCRNYNIDKAHTEAMDEVAQKWQIAKQTVQDMCTRVLGLDGVSKFRHLLETWVLGNPTPLLEHLKKYTSPRFHSELEKIILQKNSDVLLNDKSITSPLKISERLDETFNFSVNPEIAKKLKVLSEMKGISTADWLKNMVTGVIEREYKIIIESEYKILLNNQRV